MPQALRLVFLGTPEFACPTLSALAGSGHEIVSVITQPDRPSGRGRNPAPPPVKVLARELDLPVWQPESIKSPEALDRLKDMTPDLLVVVAFGQMLPADVLAVAPMGALNLHPSLLPAYRGAAPINWAIINGETETGVTTMLLDDGMDTGPLLLSRKTPIGREETAGELHERLADMGAALILESIDGLKSGTLEPRPQPEDTPFCCRLLCKADGRLDWSKPAEELAVLVRGLDPWPGAYTTFKGKNLKVYGALAGPGKGTPGQVLTLHEDRLHVAAGQGSLALAELHLAGKKRQSAKEFWHGQRLGQDDFFE